MRIVRLDEKTRREVLGNLLSRNRTDYGAYEASVREIVEQVRTNGDEALFGYTEKFDKVKLTPDTVRVSDAEIGEAYSEVSQELLCVIRKALENIRAFHEKQKRNSWFDTREEGTAVEKSRCLCTGREGGLSVVRPDEYCAGEGGRRVSGRYGDAAGEGWKSQPQYAGCGA